LAQPVSKQQTVITVSHYEVSPMIDSPEGDSVPVLQSLPRHVDISHLRVLNRPEFSGRYDFQA